MSIKLARQNLRALGVNSVSAVSRLFPYSPPRRKGRRGFHTGKLKLQPSFRFLVSPDPRSSAANESVPLT